MGQEKMKKLYRSCYYLESGIAFNPEDIVFCCDRESPAMVPIVADTSKTVDAFLETRERVIRENQGANPPCAGCNLFQKCEPADGKIRYVCFADSNYCNFSCEYCTLQHENAQVKNTPEKYDSMVILEELKRRGLLSAPLEVACASGEITIHPRKNEYYDFIEENANITAFASNAITDSR